jgi:uncharacterized membrane protein
MRRSTYVAQAGIIAAVYAGFTWLVLQLPGGLGWGIVQLRLSEALTVVALFTPAAIPGLTLGSVVANLANLAVVGPVALLDVVFGSLGTLLGAVWMWHFRSRTGVGLLGPVIFNALIVPAYLPVMLKGLGLYRIPLLGVDLTGHWGAMYAFGVVSVALGEAIVMYGLGLPLVLALRKLGVDRILADR